MGKWLLRNKRSHRIMAIVLITALVTTGCGDAAPIERRVLVLVIGYDKGKEKDKPLALVLDIHNPKQADANTQIPPEPTAGPPVLAPRLEGSTFDECIQLRELSAPRRVDLGLTTALVITERAAKEDIFPFLSWAMFQPDVRKNAFVLVTTSDLQKMFTEKPRTVEGTQGGNIVVSQLSTGVKTASIATVHLWEVYRTYLDGTGCVTMPLIRSAEGKIHYDGGAVFTGGKMVGTVDPHETALITMILEEKVPYLYTISFKPPVFAGITKEESQCKGGQKSPKQVSESQITLRINSVQRKYDVQRLGPKQYTAKIKIEIDAMLSDAIPPKVRYERADFEAMNEQAAQAFLKDAEKMLEKTRTQFKSDVLHIGRHVRARDIREWRDMNWAEVWPTVPVEFEVRFRVLGATR